MFSDRRYFVYILTNSTNRVLYTGVTNNLSRRLMEHQSGTGSSFTRKYRVGKLIYYEVHDSAYGAITREKKIKGGSRRAKERLIQSVNPEWRDLAGDLVGEF
ncbi:MAG: GIY-YIG nuclease family protein [Ignavibacteria bacterium]|nr:GIY-YIG nuclease family protein [Ignavibacteria bacterium]